MLLLFDIDGTLIRCGGAGRRALERAFFDLHGVRGALDKVRLDGRTDPGILEDAFQLGLGRAATVREVERLQEAYLSLLALELVASGNRYNVLNGVRELLEEAHARGRFVLGLATGNIERGARLKLEPGALNTYFDFGGFGSDAKERPELVRRAIDRGQARASVRLGRRLADVWVFGDTALDVHAAHQAGAFAVGVRYGCSDLPELEQSGADLMVDSFEDPVLRRMLGLAD